MKKGATFGLLLLFLGPVGSDRTTSALGGSSADEETVRSFDNQERKAVQDRNYAPHEHLWCEQITVNSPENRVVVGRPDVLAAVQQHAHYSSFDRKIEFIHIDGSIAIIMGAETIQRINDASLAGKPIQRRFTNIWKQDGETWCLMARHANVVSAQMSP